MPSVLGIGARFIEKHGFAKAVEVIGRNESVVRRWEGGMEPTVADLQRLLDFDPELIGGSVSGKSLPIAESIRAIDSVPPHYEWPKGELLAICMPTSRTPEIATMKAILRLFERDKMEFIEQSSNFIIRARNQLAAKFLAGKCQWSFWIDDDIVLPCGDVQWFREVTGNPTFPMGFANINPITRLMSHNQKIIGGCYFSRWPTGRAQFNEAHVNNLVDRTAHSGPANEIRPTRWIAAGCMLVHRDVFLDIIKTQGESIRVKNPDIRRSLGYEYRFFTPPFDHEEMADNSEDVAFCIRAGQAGYTIYVDRAVYPGHIGKTVFGHHNTGTKPYYL